MEVSCAPLKEVVHRFERDPEIIEVDEAWIPGGRGLARATIVRVAEVLSGLINSMKIQDQHLDVGQDVGTAVWPAIHDGGLGEGPQRFQGVSAQRSNHTGAWLQDVCLSREAHEVLQLQLKRVSVQVGHRSKEPIRPTVRETSGEVLDDKIRGALELLREIPPVKGKESSDSLDPAESGGVQVLAMQSKERPGSIRPEGT